MTVRGSLRSALGDFYGNSWRLVPANAFLTFVLLAVLVAASYVQLALVGLVLVFPVALALMHVAVVLARDRVLESGCFADGLRAHWRRGLQLGAANLLVLGGGAFGIAFYARGSTATLPFAFALGYLLVSFCVLQLLLWPLAVDEPHAPLHAIARRATAELFRRPATTFGLAVALLLVNAAGLAAAVLPFLTLTIAYSFLAAAHFALPRRPLPEG
jgi:hypothetical protein